MSESTPPPEVTAEEFVNQTPTEREEYLAAGGTPPFMSDEQVRTLPPAERDDYFAALAASGVDEGELFSWIERIGKRAQGAQRGQEMNAERMRELASSGETEYVGGLPPSDANYPGIPHAELARYVREELNPDEVGEISTAYHELNLAFAEFAQELSEAVAQSRHEWQGAAADSAHGYFASLGTWADGNSRNAELASQTMNEQAASAGAARNNMPEEVPFDWKTEVGKWAENPLDLLDNVEQTTERYHRSQQAHDEAARVMGQYDGELHGAASKQPAFAEPPEFNGGTGTTPSSVTSVGSPGTTASGAAGTAPVGGAPGGAGPAGSGPSAGPLPGGSVTGGGRHPDGSTLPTGSRAGTTPPGAPGGADRRGAVAGGAVPVGGMGPAGGQGASGSTPRGSRPGGFGPGAGARVAGGFGPGGGSGTAGPGATSGGARPGAMPGAAAPGGAGAAAAAGRGGAMGGAPMGAGANRGGQGGEDEEHQRPSYLVEADPDDLFGTEERTAPPVIGE